MWRGMYLFLFLIGTTGNIGMVCLIGFLSFFSSFKLFSFEMAPLVSKDQAWLPYLYSLTYQYYLYIQNPMHSSA